MSFLGELAISGAILPVPTNVVSKMFDIELPGPLDHPDRWTTWTAEPPGPLNHLDGWTIRTAGPPRPLNLFGRF